MNIWIIRRLGKALIARWRQEGCLKFLFTAIWSLRVLAHLRDIKALLQLDLYRNCVCVAANENTFHFLSQRTYLVAGLSASNRLQCVLSHYLFEEATFGPQYWSKVYLEEGICLWSQEAGETLFAVVLKIAPRWHLEGELSLTFYTNEICLHAVSFNWITGSLIGAPQQTLPLIARNPGRGFDSEQAFAAFNLVFPNNSPSFFCFAAMQGLTLAVGLNSIAGVKASFKPPYLQRKSKNRLQRL